MNNIIGCGKKINVLFSIYYNIYYLQKFGCTLIWNKSFFTWISDEFLIMFTLSGLSYVIIFTGFKQVEIYYLWEPSPYRILYHHSAADVCQYQYLRVKQSKTLLKTTRPMAADHLWGLWPVTGARWRLLMRGHWGWCWPLDSKEVTGAHPPSPGGKVTEAGLCPPEKGAAPDRVGKLTHCEVSSDNILSWRSRSRGAHLCSLSLFLLTFPAFCFCSRLTVTGESPMSNPGLEQPFCQSNHDINIWTSTPIINQPMCWSS